MQGPLNPINRDGTLNARNLQRAAEFQYAWSNPSSPFWQGFQVTSSGVQSVDQEPKEILAIIGTPGGSGSGGGTGSGVNSNALPANDQTNAYSWVEGQWVNQNDDLVVIELPNGRSGTLTNYPAIERNGVTDVPSGFITWIKPAFADGVWFYEFEFSGETGSGSGLPITIICSDGSTHTATISGHTITAA